MDPEYPVETVFVHLLVVGPDCHDGGSHHLAAGFGWVLCLAESRNDYNVSLCRRGLLRLAFKTSHGKRALNRRFATA